MKWIILLLFIMPSIGQQNKPDWKMVWSDEFNYSGLPDTAKWGNEVGFIRNNELQYYTIQRLENSRVENGNLIIIGRKEFYKNANYTSASLVTDGKFSWTYGKIEARIKLPKGQGFWPAFWLLGQNISQVGWPKCGEIDIMEHINNEDILYGTLHWDNGKHVSSGGKTPCDVTQYHIYSIEWDKDAVKWFLDGKKYWEVSIKDGINSTEEFQKPHYIILNLAIGGDWPKNPDITTAFPDTMFVDYVRVYQNIGK
jgi:beta-glucanase (GH16 family)